MFHPDVITWQDNWNFILQCHIEAAEWMFGKADNKDENEDEEIL